jgi:hypothetical protein
MAKGKKVSPEQPVADTYVRIASSSDVASKKERELLEKLAEAQSKIDKLLGVQQANEQQIAALEAAQRQGALYSSSVEEKVTGHKVKIRVFDHYKVTGYRDNGSEIVRPVFRTDEVPSYYYKIDMPPCGDTNLSINGEKYYHGAVYEFDIHTLRTVKDIVARTWAHDRSLHPNDENFYRRDPSWMARNNRAITRGVL